MITDTEIRTLRKSKTWSTIWLREFAIALGEITTVNKPAADHKAARARCARLLDDHAKARCPARGRTRHVADVCGGTCCTTCAGPIDANEECRC